MKFFQLNHPSYRDDYEFEKHNPFEISHENSVPGITCDICGEAWSNVASRLPVEVQNESFLKEFNKPNMKLSEHQSLRLQFEKEAGIKVEPSVFPGARIGKISLKIKRRLTSEFLWSWEPGTVFVTEEIVRVFGNAKVSGCLFHPVEIINTTVEIPDIFELVVTGKAGPAARKSNISIICSCESCGRVEYGKFTNGIHIEQSSWDGTDICCIKEYPTYILVSEKVKTVLETNNFKNYILTPTEDICPTQK